MTKILKGLAVAMGCAAAGGFILDIERAPAYCALLLVAILLLLRIARRPLPPKGAQPTESLPADEKHLDAVKASKSEEFDHEAPSPQESKSEVSGPEWSRPSGRLEELPSSGTMAVPNDEALNRNARALQVPAPARPEGRNPEKVRRPDGMGGCLTEEEKNEIKRVLEALATKPCPWYKRADLLKDLLSEVSIENGDEAFCAIIIDFVVNENGWKRESCEACRDDEVLAPASFVGEKESILEAIRAKYLDCVVGCVEELGKDHPEGRWLATTLRVDIYNKMSCGVTEIPQEGNPSGGLKWWYTHKVKGIIVEIPSKENCRAWDGPENERIGLVKDFHNRKLDLLGKLEGRGVGYQIEKGGYEYRFFYSLETSDSEEKKEEKGKRAEQARRPRGPNIKRSLSEENKKKIQHTLNGLAKKPFPWYTKDLLLRKLFDLSELSNVNEDSPVLKRRVLDFVVNENGWKRESGAADQDNEVLAPASFVGENRSIREAAQAHYKKVQCGILVIPDKGRDPDGKDLKKEQREFLDKLRCAWTRRRRIVVELRPQDNDDGYRYFYYPGIFDPAAPVDENGDESLKNWESNSDCAVEMVVDEMDIRNNQQQGLFWEDLRAAILNAKIVV